MPEGTHKMTEIEGGDLGRIYNFSAGPCQLPLEVMEEIKGDLLNYKGCGMSVMEMSHRSKEFANIMAEAQKDMRDILSVPDNYKIMYLQGGATLQFSGIPLNLFGGPNALTKADVAQTGQWGEKLAKEVKKYGTANLVCDTNLLALTTVLRILRRTLRLRRTKPGTVTPNAHRTSVASVLPNGT